MHKSRVGAIINGEANSFGSVPLGGFKEGKLCWGASSSGAGMLRKFSNWNISSSDPGNQLRLGNAFYVILQKRNRHFLAEYEAFKQEILHLQNILQNLKILFCQQFCNSENSDYCVGFIYSAILHLKNDTSFCKNNPTQKPQPYRKLSYDKAGVSV